MSFVSMPPKELAAKLRGLEKSLGKDAEASISFDPGDEAEGGRAPAFLAAVTIPPAFVLWAYGSTPEAALAILSADVEALCRDGSLQ